MGIIYDKILIIDLTQRLLRGNIEAVTIFYRVNIMGMDNRSKKLYTEYKIAHAIIQKLLEERQDEVFLNNLCELSCRQKRMLAAELAMHQKELNWNLHEKISGLFAQLQESLDRYLLDSSLTDYIGHFFYPDSVKTIIQTFQEEYDQ